MARDTPFDELYTVCGMITLGERPLLLSDERAEDLDLVASAALLYLSERGGNQDCAMARAEHLLVHAARVRAAQPYLEEPCTALKAAYGLLRMLRSDAQIIATEPTRYEERADLMGGGR